MGRGGRRILVVEDSAELRELISVTLARAGHEVVLAGTGEEALAIAARETPALVLLDVHLPGTSGYAVCNELRRTLGDGIPIMFVSGTRTESFDRVAGLLIGADDYVTKPLDPDELVVRVRRLLERPRAASLGRSRNHPGFGLTQREREILGLLVHGMTQAEIAGKLQLSPKTVGTHIQRVMGKMGVKSRTQAVALAAQEGLFEPIS
jgi:DNA-binding response OmpR family regulator